MPIELERKPGEPLAQSMHIRHHGLTTDVAPAGGGNDAGPSPHDLYDAALGACKALTVMWYARKKGIPVDDVKTVIERDDSQERAGNYRLTARLRISGELTEAQLLELAAAAEKCPLHKLMTTVTTDITTTVERLT